MTIVYFVIALGVLVFIHEFGHFIFAKAQGIGVEKFSLGFGPKIFGFRKGETEYLFSALPFGGYVKLMGEDPNDPEAGNVPPEKSYSKRPIWQRVKVVFAGPGMNLVLALALMPIVFMVGRMEPVYLDQKPVIVGVRKDSAAEKLGLKKGDEILGIGDAQPATWKDAIDYILLNSNKEVDILFKRGADTIQKKVTIATSQDTHAGTLGIEPGYFIGNEAVVDGVVPGGPADKAGIKPGDEVLKIGGVPIETWTDMSDEVGKSEGKKIDVVIRRAGDQTTAAVTPQFDEGMKKWLLGIRKDAESHQENFIRKKYSPLDAVIKGTQENVKLAGLTLSVLGRLVTFKLSYKALGGPIRIAQASAMAAKSGLADFLYFLAFLSIQLGVLNLLPMPVLDGGHLFFFAIEGIQGRPLSTKVRQIFEQVGFFLLISLMLLVTLNDLQSIFGIGQFFEKIKHLF